MLKYPCQLLRAFLTILPTVIFLRMSDPFRNRILAKILTLFANTVHRKKSFPSKESDTKIVQSIYFAYEVGIISSCQRKYCFALFSC